MDIISHQKLKDITDHQFHVFQSLRDVMLN